MQMQNPGSLNVSAARLAELEDFLDRAALVVGADVVLTVAGGDKVVPGKVIDVEAQDGRFYAVTVQHTDGRFSTVFASGLVAVTR